MSGTGAACLLWIVIATILAVKDIIQDTGRVSTQVLVAAGVACILAVLRERR